MVRRSALSRGVLKELLLNVFPVVPRAAVAATAAALPPCMALPSCSKLELARKLLAVNVLPLLSCRTGSGGRGMAATPA